MAEHETDRDDAETMVCMDLFDFLTESGFNPTPEQAERVADFVVKQILYSDTTVDRIIAQAMSEGIDYESPA